MVLGMALAPRRFAGSVMSAGAIGTAWLLSAAGGASFGSGSLVSLLLIGPMMDVALRHARSGWRVYAALVLAGVATNVLALASRAALKVLGLDLAGGARPFDSWWLQASVTYTLSGVVAGLLGALCWFHFNDRATQRAARVIYVGIDDTDIVGSPGTNQLARMIVRRLGPVARGAIVCRHQLFFDPRVPYTSGNGSASIQLPHGERPPARRAHRQRARGDARVLRRRQRSGLAVATNASDDDVGVRGACQDAKWSRRPTRARWRLRSGVISRVWAAPIRASSVRLRPSRLRPAATTDASCTWTNGRGPTRSVACSPLPPSAIAAWPTSARRG